MLEGILQYENAEQKGGEANIIDEALRYDEAACLIQNKFRCRKRFNYDLKQGMYTNNLQNTEGSLFSGNSVEMKRKLFTSLASNSRKRSKIDTGDIASKTRSSSSNELESVVSHRAKYRRILDIREHWLWRSLRAYSMAERAAACRLLLAGFSNFLKSSSTTNPYFSSDDDCVKRNELRRLQNRIMNRILFMLNHYVVNNQSDRLICSLKSSVRSMTLCPRARLAVELGALLDYFWTCDTRVACTTTGISDVGSTQVIPVGSAFCLATRRNWKWLTKSIWLCACRVREQLDRQDGAGSEMLTAAASLATFSHIVFRLSVCRTLVVRLPSTTSTDCSKDTGKTPWTTSINVSSAKKKSSNVTRRRSNSSSSARSGDKAVNRVSSRRKSVGSASNVAGARSKGLRCSAIKTDDLSQNILRVIETVNSNLLWNAWASDDIDRDLSSLACLIGAFRITQEFLGSTDNQCRTKQISSSFNEADCGVCGESVVSFSGEAGAATIIALRRAARTLESLICPTMECKVKIRAEKEKKESAVEAAVNSAQKQNSSDTEAALKSKLDLRQEQRRRLRQQIQLQQETIFHHLEQEEDEADDDDLDEEDDIIMEAADNNDEDDDEDVAHTEAAQSETVSTAETAKVSNSTLHSKDQKNSEKEGSSDQIEKSDGHDEAELDEQEDQEDDGSCIPDEEEDDIESLEGGEEDDEDGDINEDDEEQRAKAVHLCDDDDDDDEDTAAHSSENLDFDACRDVDGERDGDDEDAEEGDDDEGDVNHGMDLDELSNIDENIALTAKPVNQNTEMSGKQLSPSLDVRNQTYLKASMQLLAEIYPQMQSNTNDYPTLTNASNRRAYLTVNAEDAIMGSINDIVKPPKKPINTKIIMQRAPTQEEFFRGSLSRNPISLSSLKPMVSDHSTANRRNLNLAGSNDDEPTVADLRQHIANDLQMADSAELIEIIVAKKILDVNLKLRVVHQVLWKDHLIESSSGGNGTSATLFSSGGASYFTSAGSAISMIFSSSGTSSERGSSMRITKDTPDSSLPPLVATYRLAGVDGEATEDTVHAADLVDPEAPSTTATSDDEREKLLENEYRMTQLVTRNRGVFILLRSIQYCIYDILRRIRRDEVEYFGKENPSRIRFKQSPPCNGLILLRHCSKLALNRKRLLQARAPTILLTLLLDVLKALEESQASASSGHVFKTNPTVAILTDLIEILTSDISSSSQLEGDNKESFTVNEPDNDAATMFVLLESIETISSSPQLRPVIAKLLPFLTYGQVDLSRELAQHFNNHIAVEKLPEYESESSGSNRATMLMNTFVQSAVGLPVNAVCSTLRTELLNCGLPERLAGFILDQMPSSPPPWTAVLDEKIESRDNNQKKNPKGQSNPLESSWQQYYRRRGLKTAFKILTGMCMKHEASQIKVAEFKDFLRACHWLETTSDNTALEIETNGVGLLAETLIDELTEGNTFVLKLVDTIRNKTKLRKKKLAEYRRNNALIKLASFGSNKISSDESSCQPSLTSRVGIASFLTDSVVGFFRGATDSSTMPKTSKGRKEASKSAQEKPAWLREAEMMEDESGITCAVCQEGRTLQPSELLGLYAYVKKVAIPIEQCGSRASIEGTNLFRILPPSLPASLAGSHVADDWFPVAKAAADNTSRTSSSSLTVTSSGGRRASIFTTTVSAGNGIHISCHRKAKQADRNHPKAPKSEWEGASLRNNRCSCNVILPLVSSRSSKVPLIAVDTALTDHQAAVSNLLGSSPKSMLWTVLHDIRFLVLRMAYGEALNVDCGGGSLTSNCQLLFYQLLMADMFDQDAQVDQPQLSQQAQALSAAVLSACAIVSAKDTTHTSSLAALARGIADAAPMAALTCILFHNGGPDDSQVDLLNSEASVPHPKRQWVMGNELFFYSFIICAGRRHALGIDGSGCQNNNRSGKKRSASFADWDLIEESDSNLIEEEIHDGTEDTEDLCLDGDCPPSSELQSGLGKKGKPKSTSTKPTIEDFQNVLRPMVTYYAILNQLSSEFSISADDVQINESAQRLEEVIHKCQRSKNIHELLRNLNLTFTINHDNLIDLLQRGMVAAY